MNPPASSGPYSDMYLLAAASVLQLDSCPFAKNWKIMGLLLFVFLLSGTDVDNHFIYFSIALFVYK